MLGSFNVAPVLLESVWLIGAFFMCVHLLACGWAFIGMEVQDSNSWPSTFSSYSAEMLYMVSMHWTFSNFQGSADIQPCNPSERAFAVVALCLACVIFPFYISSITSRILQVQSLVSQKSEAFSQLHDLIVTRGISLQNAAAARFQLRLYFDQRHHMSGESVIQLLPETLQVQLLCEMRLPAFRHLPFLRHIEARCEPLARNLCSRAFESRAASTTEVIFTQNDVCNVALCFETGQAHYDFGGAHRTSAQSFTFLSSPTYLGSGPISGSTWFCEGALWLLWQNFGTLVSLSYSRLLQLHVDSFHKEVKEFPEMFTSASHFAHFWQLCVMELEGDDRCTDRGLDIQDRSQSGQ